MRWIALALIGVLAQGCSEAPRAPGPAEEAAAVSAPAAEEALYVDVRTPEEYASGHVAGAINIPHDQMEARWQELAAHRDRPIVLYCRTGRRSELAIEVLEDHGFARLRNGGGLDDLSAAGVPTER